MHTQFKVNLLESKQSKLVPPMQWGGGGGGEEIGSKGPIWLIGGGGKIKKAFTNASNLFC